MSLTFTVLLVSVEVPASVTVFGVKVKLSEKSAASKLRATGLLTCIILVSVPGPTVFIVVLAFVIWRPSLQWIVVAYPNCTSKSSLCCRWRVLKDIRVWSKRLHQKSSVSKPKGALAGVTSSTSRSHKHFLSTAVSSRQHKSSRCRLAEWYRPFPPFAFSLSLCTVSL